MTRHQAGSSWKLGLGLSMVTTVLWGMLPLALAVLLKSVTAETVMACRFTAASIVLAIILGSRRALPRLTGSSWVTLGLLGVAIFGLFGNYLFFQWGLGLTTPGTAQILLQTSPVLFLLGSVVFFRERLSLFQGAGLAVMVVGFGLFFWKETGGITSEWRIGLVFLSIAAVSWALYALAQKQLLTVFSSQGIMLCVYAGGALLSLPYVKLGSVLHLDASGLWILAFTALNTLLAYGAFAEALVHWEASRVSAILSLAPVLTLILAAVADHFFPGVVRVDDLSILNTVGAALVVLGSVATALGRRRQVVL